MSVTPPPPGYIYNMASQRLSEATRLPDLRLRSACAYPRTSSSSWLQLLCAVRVLSSPSRFSSRILPRSTLVTLTQRVQRKVTRFFRAALPLTPRRRNRPVIKTLIGCWMERKPADPLRRSTPGRRTVIWSHRCLSSADTFRIKRSSYGLAADHRPASV